MNEILDYTIKLVDNIFQHSNALYLKKHNYSVLAKVLERRKVRLKISKIMPEYSMKLLLDERNILCNLNMDK